MSYRPLFDIDEQARTEAMHAVASVARGNSMRTTPDLEEAISAVAAWQEKGVAPEGYDATSLRAFGEIAYVRRHVQSLLRVRQHANGNGNGKPHVGNEKEKRAPKHMTDMPLLSAEEIERRNSANRIATPLLNAFLREAKVLEHLDRWYGAHQPFTGSMSDTKRGEYACLYHCLAKRSPEAARLLKAKYVLPWDYILKLPENITSLRDYASIEEAAERAAVSCGMAATEPKATVREIRGPARRSNALAQPVVEKSEEPASRKGPDDRIPESPSDLPPALTAALAKHGLTENVATYGERYRDHQRHSIPYAIAQKFAVVCADLSGDPESLATLRNTFTGIPWTYVDGPAKTGGTQAVTQRIPEKKTIDTPQQYVVSTLLPAFLESLPASVSDALNAAGAMDNLLAFFHKYRKKWRMSVPVSVARQYAQVIDVLRDTDPEGLQALYAKLPGFPWYFTNRFTKRKLKDVPEFAKPLQKTEGNATDAADIAEASPPSPEVILHIEPGVIPATDPAPAEAHVQDMGYSAEEMAHMAAVSQTEESVMAPLTEIESLLAETNASPEVRARILNQIGIFAKALADGIELHGRPAMEPFITVADGNAAFGETEAVPAAIEITIQAPVQRTVVENAPTPLPDFLAAHLDALEGDARDCAEKALRHLEDMKGSDGFRTPSPLTIGHAIAAETAASASPETLKKFYAHFGLNRVQCGIWRTLRGDPMLERILRVVPAAPVQPQAVETSAPEAAADQAPAPAPVADAARAENDAPDQSSPDAEVAIPAAESDAPAQPQADRDTTMEELSPESPANDVSLPEADAPANEEAAVGDVAPIEETFETEGFPYPRGMDPETRARCERLVAAIRIPEKIPGSKKRPAIGFGTKRAGLELAELVKPFGGVDPMVAFFGIDRQMLSNWRTDMKRLRPDGDATVPIDTSAKDAASIRPEQQAAGTPVERNGHVPTNNVRPGFLAGLKKEKRTDDEDRKPKKKARPDATRRMEVNAYVAPPAAQSLEEYEAKATDGRKRSERLAIVRGALERSKDPTQRDAWYAQHNVAAAQIIEWSRVYKVQLAQPSESANGGLKSYKRPATVRKVQEYIDDIVVILMNPFDDVAIWTKIDEDFEQKANPQHVGRHHLASQMNPFTPEQIGELNGIARTDASQTTPEAIDTWVRLIAMRFGLSKSTSREFALAVLASQRDFTKVAELKKAAAQVF